MCPIISYDTQVKLYGLLSYTLYRKVCQFILYASDSRLRMRLRQVCVGSRNPLLYFTVKYLK